MQSDFERAMAFREVQEGGWADDWRDRGGLTRYGITLAAARRYGLATLDDLTRELATEISRTLYWRPSGADALPWPLSICVFDWFFQSRPEIVRAAVARIGIARDPYDAAWCLLFERARF